MLSTTGAVDPHYRRLRIQDLGACVSGIIAVEVLESACAKPVPGRATRVRNFSHISVESKCLFFIGIWLNELSSWTLHIDTTFRIAFYFSFIKGPDPNRNFDTH